MAAIMPRPAKPTPASAPPRLPSKADGVTGVTVAVPAVGPGAVPFAVTTVDDVELLAEAMRGTG